MTVSFHHHRIDLFAQLPSPTLPTYTRTTATVRQRQDAQRISATYEAGDGGQLVDGGERRELCARHVDDATGRIEHHAAHILAASRVDEAYVNHTLVQHAKEEQEREKSSLRWLLV